MEVGNIISLKHLGKGTVKFVGQNPGRDGIWIGIDLVEKKGKNNGTVRGIKFFECEEGHGILAKKEDVLKIMDKLAVSSSTTSLPKFSGSGTDQNTTPKSANKLNPSVSHLGNSPNSPLLLSPENEIIETPKAEQKHETPNSTPQTVTKMPEPILKTPQTADSPRQNNQEVHTPKIDTTPHTFKASLAAGSSPIQSSPAAAMPLLSPAPSEQPSLEENDESIAKLRARLLAAKKKSQTYINNNKTLRAGIEKEKKSYAAEMANRKNEAGIKLLTKKIQQEEEAIKKEEESIASAQRVRELAEAASETTAKQKVKLLQDVNNAHSEYEQALDNLINTQRINLSAVEQSIGILRKRISRSAVRARHGEQGVEALRKELSALEESLSAKQPEWKALDELRTAHKGIQDEETKLRLMEELAQADISSTLDLIEEATKNDCPLAALAADVAVAKELAADEGERGMKLLHALECVDFTLAGFFTSSTAPQLAADVKNALNSLRSGKVPSESSIMADLRTLSDVPLDSAVSAASLGNLSLFDGIIHPSVLPDEEVNSLLGLEGANNVEEEAKRLSGLRKPVKIDIDDFFIETVAQDRREKTKAVQSLKSMRDHLNDAIAKAERECAMLLKERNALLDSQ